MPPAPIPLNESDRLTALRGYEILDTACEESFDTIVRLAAQLTETPIALVSLTDSHRQWFKARYGLEATELDRNVAFCGYVVNDSSRPLVIEDATKDARFADNPLVIGAPDLRFYAGAPLVNPEGFALGSLCVMDVRPRVLTTKAVETLVGLAQTVTTTLELRRAMRQAQLMALTDGLTNIPNRAAFQTALQAALGRRRQDGEHFTLLVLDLDGFKRVNDSFGHSAGDRVLVKAADVLRGAVRREDTVARLGGDEFAVLLAGADWEQATLAAERIRSTIEATMVSRGWAVTASVGGMTFDAAPADEAAALVMTDKLLYLAKAAGKNRVVLRRFSGVERTLETA